VTAAVIKAAGLMLLIWAARCVAQTASPQSPAQIQVDIGRDLQGPQHELRQDVVPGSRQAFTFGRLGELGEFVPADPREPRHNATGCVSAARLRHKTPEAAKKAYKQGRKLAGQKKHEEAAAAFEEAIREDPQFAEAHGELGIQDYLLQRFVEADFEMRSALAVDKCYRPDLREITQAAKDGGLSK
jgi:tetratricopeptide (TPR) repeat protein